MWRVCIYIFLHGATAPNGPGLHDCTHTHHTLPNNTQQSQETDIHAPAGFEPAIPASERPPESACMIFFRYLMPSFLKIDATLSIFLTSGWIMGPTHTHIHTQNTRLFYSRLHRLSTPADTVIVCYSKQAKSMETLCLMIQFVSQCISTPVISTKTFVLAVRSRVPFTCGRSGFLHQMAQVI